MISASADGICIRLQYMVFSLSIIAARIGHYLSRIDMQRSGRTSSVGERRTRNIHEPDLAAHGHPIAVKRSERSAFSVFTSGLENHFVETEKAGVDTPATGRLWNCLLVE